MQKSLYESCHLAYSFNSFNVPDKNNHLAVSVESQCDCQPISPLLIVNTFIMHTASSWYLNHAGFSLFSVALLLQMNHFILVWL